MARRGWKEEDKRQTKKNSNKWKIEYFAFFLPEISLSSHDSSRGVTRWWIVFFLFISIFSFAAADFWRVSARAELHFRRRHDSRRLRLPFTFPCCSLFLCACSRPLLLDPTEKNKTNESDIGQGLAPGRLPTGQPWFGWEIEKKKHTKKIISIRFI